MADDTKTDTQEDETSSDSSTDTNNTDQTQSDEGEQNSDENKDSEESEDGGEKDRGYADDPRWIQRENDWKDRYNEQETRHSKDIADLRKDLTPEAPKDEGATSDEPMPSWWGGDEATWKSYQAHQTARDAKVREATIKEFTDRGAGEQKQVDESEEVSSSCVSVFVSSAMIILNYLLTSCTYLYRPRKTMGLVKELFHFIG